MKKSLLFATLATVASITYADQKTVTFDFSNPATYGYEAPAAGQGTAVDMNGTIVSDGVTITNTNTQESATAVRFYNSNGTITFRLATGGNITVTAAGTITSLSWAGANNDFNTNFTATPATGWSYDSEKKTASWTGSAESINIVRANGTIQFATMTVVYETAEGGNGGGTVGETEKYTAISWDGATYTVSDEFKAVADAESTNGGIATNAENGMSVVKFGTASVSVEAVSGTTPKDVTETEAGVFPGWAEWNDVKWDWKNQGDISFGYIVGTGNPVVEIGAEAVTTEDVPTGVWRASYTYYEADGSKGMPVMGLYYKFTIKETGLLKIAVWSNKGNRKTFIVDEATKAPIKMRAEGYINGQNNEEGKKRFLSTDEIQAIHDASGNAGDPYIIGAGNQPFWGNLIAEVEKDQVLWVFQHSSQIGFQGFEFTPGAKDAIQTVKAIKADNVIYDLCGNRVAKMQSGRIYIQNGKKVIVR